MKNKTIYNRNYKGEYVSGLTISKRFLCFVAFMTFILLGTLYSIVYAPIANSQTQTVVELKEGSLKESLECGETSKGFSCDDPSLIAGYILSIPAAYSGKKVVVTGYTSRVEETDDSPCISADGRDICKRHAEGQRLCAGNDLPLGSKIHIEGIGECKIVDRLNARYNGTGRIDLYFGMDLKAARQHGAKKLTVTRL